MKPPATSTLFRMQQTALAEQQRLELIEDAPAYVVDKRDDFAGIVRLLELIQSDKIILDQLKARRMKAQELLATDTDVETAE